MSKKTISPAHTETTHQNSIVFRGVKTHNLKNIDITIPKDKLITVT
ncbi:hypothetical protein GW750_08320 [bacterium]|nr:hypothetical protein [bacterium]